MLDIFGPLGGVNIAKNQKGDFKIFKSHYTFEQMPKEAQKCKFVIIFREPHDAFVSFFEWDKYFGADMVPFATSITMDDYYQERYLFLINFLSTLTRFHYFYTNFISDFFILLYR